MCRNDPNEAWKVIQELKKIDSSDKMLANVAAGPLEDLLAWHGDKLIDKVERMAKNDPVFQRMLGAVWKNEISDSVWKRLKKVAGKSF